METGNPPSQASHKGWKFTPFFFWDRLRVAQAGPEWVLGLLMGHHTSFVVSRFQPCLAADRERWRLQKWPRKRDRQAMLDLPTPSPLLDDTSARAILYSHPSSPDLSTTTTFPGFGGHHLRSSEHIKLQSITVLCSLSWFCYRRLGFDLEMEKEPHLKSDRQGLQSSSRS